MITKDQLQEVEDMFRDEHILKEACHPSEQNAVYKRGYYDGAMDLYNKVRQKLGIKGGLHG